ncbi:MAG TPA: ATP-binding cassette domain-containing protein, partial [Synergistetes bacterium]|nr:ATP-binding cassette domain-containing protein [Synergistota bacterium]
MLSELIVSNIGGIRDATLNFRGKFIAITGESGAGKSSLVRALELASGKRAQSSQIRAGVDEAEVQAVLEMDGPVPSLPDDLQPQEGIMVIRRLVSSTGRARSYLQERPVPLNTVNSALSNVIAIQSQFAQLGLLEPSRQVEMLDNSGGQQLKDTRAKLSRMVSLALETERKLIEMNRRRRETEAACQDGESFLARYRNLKIHESSCSEWETSMNDISTSLKNQRKLRIIHDRLTGGSSGEGILSSIENLCSESRLAVPSDTDLDTAAERFLGGAQEFVSMIRNI